MDSHSSGKVFNTIVHIENNSYHCVVSQISSEPLHICPCENNLPVCNKSQYHVPHTVYPGETFQVSVDAAGQRGGTVPSTVRSVIMRNEQGNLHEYQYLQPVNNTCTTLSYTMFTLSQYVNIILTLSYTMFTLFQYANIILTLSYTMFTLSQYANIILYATCPTFEGKYIYSLLQLSISVNINQTCPPGFNISESSCVCEARLVQYAGTRQCSIQNGLGQITRDSDQRFWVGYITINLMN